MHTILIADDSQTIQRAVEIVFDKEPFRVVKASSAREALQRARDASPHLVLVDHSMPDQAGLDVAEALHADPATAQIPVVMLTAASAPYDEARARAAGVLGHVQKPFDCATLLDRVKSILGVTASGPVAGAATTAATPAAVAATPRPPSGIPLGIGGLTRSGVPPAGLPRPPSTGAGASASDSAPFAQTPSTSPGFVTGVPAAASASPAAPARAPTPMPARDLDPFGFGSSLSRPPQTGATAPTAQPAAQPNVQAAPTASAAHNPFGGAAAARPLPSNASAAPVVARAASDGFDVAIDDIAPRPSTTAASQGRAEQDFREVSDVDLGVPNAVVTPIRPDPHADKITANLDGARLAALAAEDTTAKSRAAAAVAPQSSASEVAAVATAAVTTQAAQAIAVVEGRAPSADVLSAEARSIVERIAWEVVPELAETIIREEIKRLLASQ